MKIFKGQLFREGAENTEKRAFVFWYFIWGFGFFGELLHAASVRIPFFGSTSSVASTVVTIILLVGAVHYLVSRIHIADYAFWLIFGLAYIVSMTLYTNNNEIQEEYIGRTMLYSVPCLFMGLMVDIDNMRKPMARISFMVILWYVFYCMYYQQSKVGSMIDNEVHENMNFAYIVLPHVLMCIWSSFKDKDYISIVGSIVGVFLLLSLGNRGSLVDLVLFLIVYILFFLKYKRKWLVYTLCLIVAGVLYYFMDAIILFFQVQLSELGMSTRIFDVLAENSFLTGNSVDERDAFQNTLIDAIRNGPFLGYGICGSWPFIGSYPHNLFYDLAITFGLIPGSILLLALVILIIKGFKACGSENEKAFLLILVIVGFVKLFISYTFLDNFETYLLIGYCLCLIRKYKKQSLLI